MKRAQIGQSLYLNQELQENDSVALYKKFKTFILLLSWSCELLCKNDIYV